MDILGKLSSRKFWVFLLVFASGAVSLANGMLNGYDTATIVGGILAAVSAIYIPSEAKVDAAATRSEIVHEEAKATVLNKSQE